MELERNIADFSLTSDPAHICHLILFAGGCDITLLFSMIHTSETDIAKVINTIEQAGSVYQLTYFKQQ